MRISFVWSRHGSQRARQRGISDEAIRVTLNNPASTMPGGSEGRLKYVGLPSADGKQVIVVASDPPDAQGTVTIITCFVGD